MDSFFANRKKMKTTKRDIKSIKLNIWLSGAKKFTVKLIKMIVKIPSIGSSNQSKNILASFLVVSLERITENKYPALINETNRTVHPSIILS